MNRGPWARVLTLALLSAALGCAAPTERESADDQVTGLAQELNFEPDFNVGIVAVKYGTKTWKSTEEWAAPLSAGTSVANPTYFSQGFLDPDGARLMLINFAPGTLPTIATDFRLTLQQWDVWVASSLQGSTSIMKTGWASEGSRPAASSLVNVGTVNRADRFQIGIETRPWPSGVTKTLVDFRIGLRRWHSFLVGSRLPTGEVVYTRWMHELPNAGDKSATATLVIDPDDTGPQIFPELEVVLSD